eukprot:403354644
MLCFNTTRCRNLHLGFGFSVIAIGITLCAFSGVMMDEPLFKAHKKMDKYRGIAFALTLTVGLLSILIGAIGMWSSKLDKLPIRIAYGFLVLTIGTSMLAGGIIMQNLKRESTQFLDGICYDLKLEEFDPNSDDHQLILFAQLYDGLIDLWNSQTMCTRECPCYTDMNLDIYTENALNLYFRTKRSQVDQTTGGLYSEIYRENNGYTNFYDCLKDQLIVNNATKYDILPPEFLNLLRVLEHDYDCSGICNSGLFYIFKDLNHGHPIGGCSYQIKGVVSRVLGDPSIVLIVGFIVCFLTFVGVVLRCFVIDIKEKVKEELKQSHQNRMKLKHNQDDIGNSDGPYQAKSKQNARDGNQYQRTLSDSIQEPQQIIRDIRSANNMYYNEQNQNQINLDESDQIGYQDIQIELQNQ